uniref:Uncharacterized protein n=1 Tax=Lygus hesperus TaxID=30085 RepID=A0A146M518_LYGHE
MSRPKYKIPNAVQRACQSISHPSPLVSLHLCPRGPSLKPYTITTNPINVTTPSQKPYTNVSAISSFVKKPLVFGGTSSTSLVAASSDNPVAGGAEVHMFNHKISIGERMNTGASSLRMGKPQISAITSATLLESKCTTNLLIHCEMRLPYATACTIVEKLSSVITKSATLFVTSTPDPIAQPTSAILILGESLKPSPVIATIRFRRCSDSIIFTLD